MKLDKNLNWYLFKKEAIKILKSKVIKKKRDLHYLQNLILFVVVFFGIFRQSTQKIQNSKLF